MEAVLSNGSNLRRSRQFLTIKRRLLYQRDTIIVIKWNNTSRTSYKEQLNSVATTTTPAIVNVQYPHWLWNKSRCKINKVSILDRHRDISWILVDFNLLSRKKSNAIVMASEKETLHFLIQVDSQKLQLYDVQLGRFELENLTLCKEYVKTC